MYVFNAPSHKRNPSPSRNLVKKCLLVRRYLPLRRLHFNRKNRPSLRMPRMSATPGAWLGMYVFRKVDPVVKTIFGPQ